MDRPDLSAKLSVYNDYYDDKPSFQITAKETDNGSLILEGQLRIHWGILHPIRLKLQDDPPPARPKASLSYRHSFSPASSNELEKLKSDEMEQRNGTLDVSPARNDEDKTVYSHVVMRAGKRRHPRRRLSIINGHLFSTESCVFTPTHGSVTTVTVSSEDAAPQVVRRLLEKFKVDNSPNEFCLCAVKASAETRALSEEDVPLLERICSGPYEDDMKFFIVEKYRMLNIDEVVAHFVNLPDAVLNGFLDKYSNDEALELEMVKEKYRVYHEKIEGILEKMSSSYL